MRKEFLNVLLMLTLTLISTNEKLSAQMFWNNACSFAGNSNSYISRGNSTSLNITGSFTIEAWVNPAVSGSTETILQKREGNNATGYGLYLFNGRVAIRTNANTRLTGRAVLPANTWSHIAASYNSSSGMFFIAINAVTDTTAVVAGAAPASGTDSLFIGNGYNGPFNGQLDEIRVWNRSLGSGDVSKFRRTSLGTNSGVYNGLVMSLTFQDRNADGTTFTLSDQSGNTNHCINKGVTAVDLSNRPSKEVNTNESVQLDGSNDYLAAPDAASLSPSDNLTLEAWIYPTAFNTFDVLIHKGTDGGSSDYSLRLDDGKLQAILNNQIVLSSDDILPLNQWSHVAFTFDGANDVNTFYLNGKKIDEGENNIVLINNGTDSLYIGGSMALPDFNGYMDEVRIKLTAKSHDEINRFLFQSIDESNDLAGTETVYNFDGNTVSSVGSVVRSYFRNGAKFSHSATTDNTPVSPLNRVDDQNFQDGFYLKTSNRRIPESGSTGSISDTINVLWNEVILDINVFVAVNHISEHNLSVTLISPGGESVVLHNFNSLFSSADNIVTVYNDEADSPLISSNYISFAPTIRPSNNLGSTFNGVNTFGKWKLVINDASDIDTGRLYGWGIQFNNRTSVPSVLQSTSIIQGFYNSSTDAMVRDTMQIYLRNFLPPYNVIDSSKRYLANSGFGTFPFNNVTRGEQYYLQLKHRNSIETWSSAPVVFDPLTPHIEYDFTVSVTRAFGNNMAEIDASPLRFGIYSGDITQDGVIDGADGALVDNDASIFASGYIVTDVTGDGITDGSDAAIVDNNVFNFVSKVTP